MINKANPKITYKFLFGNGRKVDYSIQLDSESLAYISDPARHYPEWTRLDYEPRCTNCPLVNQNMEYCPIAVNLVDVVHVFKDTLSYEPVDCEVITHERTYNKRNIQIQSALSSLLGIIMVTSGCPALDKLRPMVKFHLPFASIEETIYRAASMYLLAQYFRMKHGFKTDLDLKGLIAVYQKIDQINGRLCRRIRSATNQDASLNAVVVLDVFAKMVPISVEETLLSFDGLFTKYLNE